MFCFHFFQVLTSILLIILAEAYSDVDLRIAERRAIPHYIRHSYEYPDIDIKKIMQERGLLPKPPNAERPRNTVTQEPWLWLSRANRRKYMDQSNHIDQPPRNHYQKKYKHYTSYGNKHYTKYGNKSKKGQVWIN